MAGTLLLSWPPWIWVWAMAAVLIAGVVRGFTGFGFALIVIGALNLVAAPAEVVPLVTILDWLAGVNMLPKVRGEVDWRGLGWLGAGCVVGAPVGVAVLVSLDPDRMRLAISLAILISVILIFRGFRLREVPGPRLLSGTGLIAGLMSGGGGIPGPPVILLYLSSPLPVRVTRANTVALFFFVDLLALALMAWNGLIVAETLLRAAVLAAIVFVGTSIGHRLFGTADPAHVKRVSLVVLAVLAIVGILKVLLD